MPSRPNAPQQAPEEQKKDRGGGWEQALRETAPYLGLGTSLAASVLLGVGGGYWLDGRLGTRPLFLLVGSGLGILAALWQVFTMVSRKP